MLDKAALSVELQKEGMQLVPGDRYGYLPKLGILYKKNDTSSAADISLAHEVSHWKLGHISNPADPWGQLKQEVAAWNRALSLGFTVDENFIKSRLSGYSGAIFRNFGVVQGEQALKAVETMLSKYYKEE